MPKSKKNTLNKQDMIDLAIEVAAFYVPVLSLVQTQLMDSNLQWNMVLAMVFGCTASLIVKLSRWPEEE